MSSDEAINSIRIKTGSLRRLFKERAMYADEVVAGQRKVASMREANAERYDVAQQVRVRAPARIVTGTQSSHSQLEVHAQTRLERASTDDLSCLSRAGKRFKGERDDGAGQRDAIRGCLQFISGDERTFCARWSS